MGTLGGRQYLIQQMVLVTIYGITLAEEKPVERLCGNAGRKQDER